MKALKKFFITFCCIAILAIIIDIVKFNTSSNVNSPFEKKETTHTEEQKYIEFGQ